MKQYIEERVRSHANELLTGKSVRQVAEITGWSKTTVHIDVTVRLRHIDKALADQCDKVLLKNFEEKHIRGGLATKEKLRKRFL